MDTKGSAHKMVYYDHAEVLANEQVAPAVYVISIGLPDIGAHFQPGQFVMVRLPDRLDPLLARPYSIHDRLVGQSGEAVGIKLLYKVVGKGTGLLAQLMPGGRVAIWGPLGKGFSIPQGCHQFVMLAGGIGAAPFLALARGILEIAHPGTPARLVYMVGAGSRDGVLLLGKMEALGAEVVVATEDGSLGRKGLLTDLLVSRLEGGEFSGDAMFYGCGPEGMLARVASLADAYGFRAELSLESMMACGFGACYGCAHKMNDSTGSGWHYELVCKDGPVFPAEKVLFD